MTTCVPYVHQDKNPNQLHETRAFIQKTLSATRPKSPMLAQNDDSAPAPTGSSGTVTDGEGNMDSHGPAENELPASGLPDSGMTQSSDPAAARVTPDGIADPNDQGGISTPLQGSRAEQDANGGVIARDDLDGSDRPMAGDGDGVMPPPLNILREPTVVSPSLTGRVTDVD